MTLESRLVSSLLAGYLLVNPALAIAEQEQSNIVSGGDVQSDPPLVNVEIISLDSRVVKGNVIGSYKLDGVADVVIASTNSGIYAKWDTLVDRIANPNFKFDEVKGFGIFEVINPVSPLVDFNGIKYFVIKPAYDLKAKLGDTVILAVNDNRSSMSFIKVNNEGQSVIGTNLAYTAKTGNFEEWHSSGWVPTLVPLASTSDLQNNLLDKQENMRKIFTQYPNLLATKIRKTYYVDNKDMNVLLDGFMESRNAEWGISSKYEISLISAVHRRVVSETISRISEETATNTLRVPYNNSDSSPEGVQVPQKVAIAEQERNWYTNPLFLGSVVVAALGSIIGAVVYNYKNGSNTLTRTEAPPKIVPVTAGGDTRGH